jgi:PHD/YefM family antitoxin component YafN of YafNO toxin-antitoxin module
MSRNVQYVTDANGERTAVILPLDEYEDLLEDLHIVRVADETKDEPHRLLTDVKQELREAGEIDG